MIKNKTDNKNRSTMNPDMLLETDFKITVFDLFRNLEPPEKWKQ